MPKRVQRRRTKGWRMPPNTVYVGRPTKWGNPFKVGEIAADKETAVQAFRLLLTQPGSTRVAYPTLEEIKSELSGKDLACFCSLDEPCHADILLELANQES